MAARLCGSAAGRWVIKTSLATTDAVPVSTELRRKRRVRFGLARPSWAAPVLLYLGLFFLAPLSSNLIRSVTQGQAATAGPLAYYVKLFTNSYTLA